MEEKIYQNLKHENNENDVIKLGDGIKGSTVTFATADFTYFPNETLGNTTQMMYYFYQTEQVTFLCILFAFIVIGNSSVLIAILLSKNRKSRMNFFIMQLAIADLSTGLITVLVDIFWKSTIEWHAGNVACKGFRYLQSVTTFASTYVLVAMSIDRLDAIARPMNFTGSGKRAKILVCAAWGLAGSFSLPMIFLNKEMTVHNMQQCWIPLPEAWHWKLYVSILALLLFIIPAIIIAICYTVIVIIIWSKGTMDVGHTRITHRFIGHGGRRNMNGQPIQQTQISTSNTSSRGVIPKARIKTIKMTLVIVLVFIICWSPFFVFDLLDVFGHIPMSQKKVAIAVFIQSLAPLNSAANPVIYCIFSTHSFTCVCRSNSHLTRRFGLCGKLCAWLVCCPCHEGYRDTSGTDFNTDFNTDMSRSTRFTPVRRHSRTPYVKVRLTQRENEILLKHVKNGPHTAIESSPGDSDENLTAV